MMRIIFKKPLQLGQRQMTMNMKSKVTFYRSFHSEIEELHPDGESLVTGLPK